MFDGVEGLRQLDHALLMLDGNGGQGLHQALLPILDRPQLNT
jgi:hypothetical protein